MTVNNDLIVPNANSKDLLTAMSVIIYTSLAHITEFSELSALSVVAEMSVGGNCPTGELSGRKCPGGTSNTLLNLHVTHSELVQ